jgi:hypothetical protein
MTNASRRPWHPPRRASWRSCSATGSNVATTALYPHPMAATPTPEGISQRLAAIRAQMSLLADYL